MKYLICTFVILILFSGCAITHVSGVKNTDYQGSAKSKIAIYCMSDNLNERVNDEQLFCNEFTNNEIEAYPLHKIIHPKEKLELNHIYSKLRNKNIEALLIIKYSKYENNNTAALSYKAQNTNSIELFETENGNLMWNANTNPQGDFSSIADETADDLLSNKIILQSKMNYYDLDFKNSGHFNKLTR